MNISPSTCSRLDGSIHWGFSTEFDGSVVYSLSEGGCGLGVVDFYRKFGFVSNVLFLLRNWEV